jgi:hypothetical protein
MVSNPRYVLGVSMAKENRALRVRRLKQPGVQPSPIERVNPNLFGVARTDRIFPVPRVSPWVDQPRFVVDKQRKDADIADQSDSENAQ